MNINATLILQSIAMMIFVWFCMKFIWPPLLKAMDDRRARVADGLAASDLAEKELETAKKTSDEQILKARDKAGEIVDQAKLAIAKVEGVETAEVQLTFDPPWTPERISPLIRSSLGL